MSTPPPRWKELCGDDEAASAMACMAAIVADAAVPVIGPAGELGVIPENDAWSSGRIVHAAVTIPDS